MTLDKETVALHCLPANGTDAHNPPIWLTTAYDFTTAEQASDRCNGVSPGNVYSRYTNPSVSDFENKLAVLEQAEAAIGVASGMAAYLALNLAFLHQGDEVVIAGGVFGSTAHLYTHYFAQFGVSATLVTANDIAAWEQAVTAKTRMMIVETPTNPAMVVVDIAALALIAKTNQALLVVDNTVLTPIFQQPLIHGADLVLHSAGKYIDGQGRCIGGAIAGKIEYIEPLRNVLRSAGMSLSPFNAWVFANGLDTLALRMRQHQSNAETLALWLFSHPLIEQVHYTSMQTRPDKQLIQRQQTGHGGLLSLVLKDNTVSPMVFINRLSIISRCNNIGDTRSLVLHPWSTTHCKYTSADKIKFGITENLVRISVGLENVNDIISDIEQALYGK